MCASLLYLSDGMASHWYRSEDQQRTSRQNTRYFAERPQFTSTRFVPWDSDSSEDWYVPEPQTPKVNLQHTPTEFFQENPELRSSKSDMKVFLGGGIRSYENRPSRIQARSNVRPSFISAEIGRNVPSPTGSFSLETIFPNWKTNIPDQGGLGTCSSFAAVTALQFVHKADKEETRLLSHPYLIVQAEKQSNCLNDGLPIGDAMKAALKIGTVAHRFWKYEDYIKNFPKKVNKKTNICSKIPFNSTEDQEYVKFAFGEVKNIFAQNCPGEKCGGESRVFSIIGALDTYKVPVVVSVPVKFGKENGWDTTGIIEYQEKSSWDGYHAITLFGYNHDKQYFDFMNSWGESWGQNGCGTINYHYVKAYASEAWIGIGTKYYAGLNH